MSGFKKYFDMKNLYFTVENKVDSQNIKKYNIRIPLMVYGGGRA